ncbi:heavy-metal-associated domain-containing protein [Sphaerisporangium perillae]|uniref:heavy-metal-associated domain-containing protein n=1 Tax=Sphaerisporangium perillae TaxID=2935860 RepID=UPI00200C32C6|nr:heavy-metal-associated domain-containing protein [Sphaerisporangium perillae]
MCTACSCGTQDSTGTTTRLATDEGAGRVYSVSGMTCGHCVSSVSAQIGKVEGVSDVQVDLAGGAVMVSGSGFSDEQIRAAVKQAGYEPAGTGA